MGRGCRNGCSDQPGRAGLGEGCAGHGVSREQSRALSVCAVVLLEEPQGQQCGAVMCWGAGLVWEALGCLGRWIGGVYLLQMAAAETLPVTSPASLAALLPAQPGFPCWAVLGRGDGGVESWGGSGLGWPPGREKGTTEQSRLSPCSLDMDMTNASHHDFHTNSFSEEFSTFF